jgi:PAS domain S-box-containing protein
MLAAFLVMAIITSDLSSRSRREALNARRSEGELREVIETIPAMAFTARPDGTNAFANRRWQDYTGLPAEEMISSLGWQSTVHADDCERHIHKWRASLASGEPFENEVRHRSANGEHRWFLIRAVPLRDEHGNILNWYGILTDIEDRKNAEEALRKSEAYLAEAQRLSKTGSWAYNPAAEKSIYWSEEMRRIFGFDPQTSNLPGALSMTRMMKLSSRNCIPLGN